MSWFRAVLGRNGFPPKRDVAAMIRAAYPTPNDHQLWAMVLKHVPDPYRVSVNPNRETWLRQRNTCAQHALTIKRPGRAEMDFGACFETLEDDDEFVAGYFAEIIACYEVDDDPLQPVAA